MTEKIKSGKVIVAQNFVSSWLQAVLKGEEYINKEAIRHYAELFLGISKYNIYLVEIILDYFAVVPSVCKYWGP